MERHVKQGAHSSDETKLVVGIHREIFIVVS